MFSASLLGSEKVRDNNTPLNPLSRGEDIGAKVVRQARKYLGVRETGYNRGPEIERFQKSHGGKPGQSWCAYFVATVLDEAGVKKPGYRKGMAQGYITNQSIRASRVAKGYVKLNAGWLAIWGRFKQGRNTGSGHIEIVTNQIRADTFEGIGGNTSGHSKGSTNDGDGVYETTRKIITYGSFRIIYFTQIE